MPYHRAFLRVGFAAALISAALSACGGAPAISSPAPSAAASAIASVAPSSAPSLAASAAPSVAASVAPSVAPSLAPSTASSPAPSVAAGVLPRPLLFMREGQIVRMEVDGQTVTPLTAEQPGQPDILAIINFDVSPVDGALAYVVQGGTGNTLVRTDASGGARTVLLDNAPVNNIRWSPDGTQLAIQLWAPVEGETGPQGGVYLLNADGGEPTLLQADDASDPANPSADVRGYQAVSWSPDGQHLLLAAYSKSVEVCSAAIKNIATGALVPIQAAAEGMVSSCGAGAWSSDSSTLYLQMARPGPQPPVPGLWQADPDTGAIEQFIQGEFESGEKQLIVGQKPLPNGQVYGFMAAVTELPEPFSGVMPSYKLWTLGKTDALPLRDEEFVVTGTSLWAPDGSGVIADLVKDNQGNVVTAWIPADGGPVVELGSFMGEAKAWAGN